MQHTRSPARAFRDGAEQHDGAGAIADDAARMRVSLRHGGASRTFMLGAEVKDIMLRGRWVCLESTRFVRLRLELRRLPLLDALQKQKEEQT